MPGPAVTARAPRAARETSRPARRGVLLCIPTLWGGGAEAHATLLATGLDRAGWEVTLATLSSGPNAARLEGTGVRLVVLPNRGPMDPRIVPRLAALIRRVRPAVVQSWMPMMNVVAGLAAGLTRTPFAGGELSCGDVSLRGWKTRLEAAVLARYAGAMVANSQGGASWVRERLGARMPIALVHSALPLEAVDAAAPRPRAPDGIADDAELLLFVGRIAPEKNPAVLFEALARVAEARPRVVAVACGEGPERAAWQEWVRRRGLEARILLPGFVNDVWSRMKSADVLVFPSLFEGHPTVVAEAMACGCPLVVSDIPAHREFLDERLALLVPVDDPATLADAVTQALDDRPAARARAARARELARRYDNAGMVAEYERVFLELAGR
ncbi:MAG TPA: glycosyltransferase [Longimicrobiaceae bacterium]|nr:glycosyltransferase [Longimicrobiaceae bacterium]